MPSLYFALNRDGVNNHRNKLEITNKEVKIAMPNKLSQSLFFIRYFRFL